MPFGRCTHSCSRNVPAVLIMLLIMTLLMVRIGCFCSAAGSLPSQKLPPKSLPSRGWLQLRRVRLL